MRIESGSQNASRTPDVYVYPIRKYSNAALEEISNVRPKPESIRRMLNQAAPSLVSDLEKLHLYSPESLSGQKKLPSLNLSKYIDILA